MSGMNNKQVDFFASSPSHIPTEAMLRQKSKFQERMRNKSGGGSEKESLAKIQKRKKENSPTGKGKNYKTKDDRKLKELSQEENFVRNKIRDTKNGSRNSRTAFSFRNHYHVGSDLYKKPRPDRAQNAADSDEEENAWLKSNHPQTDKHGVPIRNKKMKEC